MDFGYRGGKVTFEHFRDESMRYVFRTPFDAGSVREGDAEGSLVALLLGYEATFSQLGDLKPGEDED